MSSSLNPWASGCVPNSEYGMKVALLNAGKLVQVGTPVDIIMNPADDYVKAFVKDVIEQKLSKLKSL